MQILLFWLYILGVVLAYAMTVPIILACIMLYVKAGTRWKIAMITLWEPLLFSLLAIAAYYPFKSTSHDYWFIAVVVIVLRHVFREKYYVQNIVVNNSVIGVNCVTNWYKSAQFNFVINDNNNARLGELRNWFDCLPKLTLKEGDVKLFFYVVDKQIYEQVKASLASSDSSIVLA